LGSEDKAVAALKNLSSSRTDQEPAKSNLGFRMSITIFLFTNIVYSFVRGSGSTDQPCYVRIQRRDNCPMKKILIVEDSVLIQKIIQDALETCFPCVLKAVADGAKAYEELANNTYDLVITDIVMPVMDGLTLAEKIRIELESDVPIIMLTSLSVKNVRDSTTASGVNAYLIKPVDIDQLIRVVKRLIPTGNPPEQDETSLP
jgi:CheY-like chemotaxis protein